MGFSTVSTSMFHPDMPQTQANVAKVLDIAGWNVHEAAEQIDVLPGHLSSVMDGIYVLKKDKWRLLLDKAGCWAFDVDEGTA